MSRWREIIEQSYMQAQVRMSEAQGKALPATCETRAWWEHIRVHGAPAGQPKSLEAEMQRADEPERAWWEHTEAERSAMAAHLAARAARMSDPPQSEPAPDTSAGAVQQRIDQVCNDLVAGRTTPVQRRGLTGAVERAGRVPSGSDVAVGRISRMPR